MDKIINTYEASAADGSTVTVYEVQLDDAGAAASADHDARGVRRMQLSDGRPLKMVGERAFKIDGTDEVYLLRRPYSP
jgi:hypothetical protein